MLEQPDMKLGDFVTDSFSGAQGTIQKMFKNFYEYSASGDFITTGDGLTWLSNQEYKCTNDEILGPWIKIDCIGGGCVVVSKTRIDVRTA